MTDNLPVLADLYDQKQIEQIKKQNDLNIILNSEPRKEWIKTHPFAKCKYIPIEIVEYLLTSIFIDWWVEIRKSEIMANSVVLTIRLHYKNPINGEERYQDGIGAAPLRTNKGAKATDFTEIQDSSVMTGAPAAKSFAIKDAAELLGKLFGKDLNRRDTMSYESLKKKSVDVSGIKPIEE